MCGNSHSDEDDEEVDPDGRICKPSKFLQRANLAKKEACKCPDEAADGITQLEFRYFRQSLAVGDDDESDTAKQLDRLQ